MKTIYKFRLGHKVSLTKECNLVMSLSGSIREYPFDTIPGYIGCFGAVQCLLENNYYRVTIGKKKIDLYIHESALECEELNKAFTMD